MKTNKNQTGRKCDYCQSKDASPLTLKNLTVVSSCESCYESGAFKSAKPTHTPGPWMILNNDGTAIGLAVVGPDAEPVATLDRDHGLNTRQESTDRAEANSRLIAAAPDLLAALKNIAGLATYKRGVDSADPSDMRDDLEGIKEAAVSAILRATEGK